MVPQFLHELTRRRLGVDNVNVPDGRPMRILYSFPHSLGSPGIGTTAWHQVAQLVAKGHLVTVVTGRMTRPLAGVQRVRKTASLAGRRIPRRTIGLGRFLAYHDLRARAVLRSGSDEFDVVHTWPLAAQRTLLAARELGIAGLREAPNTHTANAYRVVGRETRALGLRMDPENSHRFNARRLATEEREWKAATGILVPSDAVARSFLQEGFAPQQLFPHRYGYHPDDYGGSAGAARRSGGLRAVFVGRCEPRKGLHHALRAWHASEASVDGSFTIYGSFAPGYRERLGTLLSHPSVYYAGFVDRPARAYAEADVLMLPSIEEGSALVTYEAMAMGCVPLVSSAAGAYLTTGIDGLVHPVGDVAALTDHLDALARDPVLLSRLREAALVSAATLTWSEAVDRLVACYRTAAAGMKGIPLQRMAEPAVRMHLDRTSAR